MQAPRTQTFNNASRIPSNPGGINRFSDEAIPCLCKQNIISDHPFMIPADSYNIFVMRDWVEPQNLVALVNV